MLELSESTHTLSVSLNVTVFNAEQYRKAESPILVTLLGISILVKLEQFQKAEEPILSSCEFFPNVTVFKAEQL